MKNTAFIFLFISSLLYSQKTYRFFYELNFKKDSTAEKYDKDFFVLDISQGGQKFYNYEFYKNDSINRSKINSEPIFSYPELDIRIAHKNNSTEFDNYYLKTPAYYLLKSNDEQQWKILPETKKYGDFNVQKATTKFGGRTWEAWFTTEFPFQYGPYKFYGLPGMILEIADTKGNYIFSFKGNKNINGNVDTSAFLEKAEGGAKPTIITQNQWNKLQMDYFINPLQGFGDGGLLVDNGNGEIVPVNTRATIQAMQKHLREDNNPIELDKAVHYPEK
jgi:GLPGLI family protein